MRAKEEEKNFKEDGMEGGDIAKRKEAEDLYKQASKYMKTDGASQKKIQVQCIQLLTDAIAQLQNNENKHESFNAQLHAFRASIFMKTDQYQLALVDFCHAIRVDDRASYYCQRGNCYQKLDEIESSLQDFKKAIDKAEKSNKPEGTYYLDRGMVYAKLQMYQKAISDFDKALYYMQGKSSKREFKFKVQFNFGNCLRKIKEYEKSIKMLKLAVKSNPGHPVAFNNLGLSYFEYKDYEQANEQFRKAIQYDPTNATYYNNKGLCLYHQGKTNKAIKAFNKSLEIDEDEPKAWYNLGNTYLKRGNREQAHIHFNKALKYDPNNCKIFHSKGLAYQDGNEYEFAIDEFMKALTKDKNHTPSKFHLGLMQHKNRQFKEALQSFKEVLKEVGPDRLVYESRGLVYQEMKNHEHAIEDFNTSIDIHPNNSLVYYYRGLSRIELGKLQEAIKDFKKAMALGEQKNPLILSGLAQAFRFTQDTEKSLYYLKEALKIAPKNYKFLVQRSQVYVDIGIIDPNNYKKAIEDLTQAKKIKKKDPQIYYKRGLAHYLHKNYVQCIKDLKKSLMFKPFASDLSNIHYHIGIAYSNLEKFTKSIPAFNRAINLQQTEARYFHERAKSYLLTKKFKQSLADFNEVIKMQPDNAHAYFGRAFAHKALNDFKSSAMDLETAQELEPDNHNLNINYRHLFKIEYIQLVKPGMEKA